jgi:uncharacterized ferredoxin-like protein
MDKSINIVRQHEKGFEPCDMVFKDLKKEKGNTMFLQRKEKNVKNMNAVILLGRGEVKYSRIFRGESNSAKNEG